MGQCDCRGREGRQTSNKMPPKEQKAKAAMHSSKGKKKKWSKGKTKEKVNNEVMYTQAAYDKMLVEVPKMKMITPSILSDRLRINGSLARATLKHLEAEGKIRAITKHSAQLIYTRATNVAVE